MYYNELAYYLTSVHLITLSCLPVLQIGRLCNVHYRKFNFTRYPVHVRQLDTYAFKPIIVHVSRSNGVFDYQFQKPVSDSPKKSAFDVHESESGFIH